MSELICWLKAIGLMICVLAGAGLIIWGIAIFVKRIDGYIDDKMQSDGWNWVSVSFAVFLGAVAIFIVLGICVFLYNGTVAFKGWVCQ